ncbi:MAG: A/G-specific adenine glycosylase [Moraxellaceae bacterium]|nr:A/G-specific adenine glycosylase [Moraxellaceae bacterium]MCP5177064.1 A/G-specific adenine glycosylase [Moraxellaceae bacterium]
MTTFSQKILTWFDVHGRHDLPWQHNPSPYRVWVSEIMLQQTQVATVIPYYQRFMASFPDVKRLAEAHEDTVLQHWAGLGYYARARNLHYASQQVVAGGGEFPNTLEGLMTLKGVGRSTAGAILSLAWQQRGVIMDGNVKRVLSRHFAISGDSSSSQVQQQLWALAEDNTPQQRFAAYTQAMMDLGATLCTRSKPLCLYCPIQSSCQAYALGTPTAFPQKKQSKVLPTKTAYFLLIHNQQQQLLWLKRPPTGIWGGLWCLPQIDVDNVAGLETVLTQQWHIKPCQLQFLAEFRHTFSHYHLLIKPVRVVGEFTQVFEQLSVWQSPQQAVKELGLPIPMQKLVAEILA